MARSEARPPPRLKAHIALFEATTLLAKGLKDQLVARAFPTASVRLFTSSEDPDANLTDFGGEAMLVARPDPDALGSLDLAFLCGTGTEPFPYHEWARRIGFTAIDLTAASPERTGVPVVNVAVNPEAIPPAPSVIAAPGPMAQILSSVLAPIRRGPGLRAATAVVFQPASGSGEGAIDELYRQTLGVLNFQDLPTAVHGSQLAFNLIPSSAYAGGAMPGGSDPARLRQEVLRVTGDGYGLEVEVVLAPVFHCHTVLLRVVLPEGRQPSELPEALRSAPDLELAPPGKAVTPVGRAGKPGILVGGVRPAEEGSAWLWAAADDLVGGTTLNAVRIAETILETGLGRGAA
ncbi:MAG: Asd/ArgC dimerization domain-containing protein [Candidatus Polarisedimenticolia bacterium]